MTQRAHHLCRCADRPLRGAGGYLGARRFVRPAVALEGRVESPRLWSAEAPRLYKLVVTVQGPSGPESHSCAVGFRSVAVCGRELLVNGRAVMIKGVNRHEHDDTTGRAVSREAMEADIRLMKQCNINAVRTSHYPTTHTGWSCVIAMASTCSTKRTSRHMRSRGYLPPSTLCSRLRRTGAQHD